MGELAAEEFGAAGFDFSVIVDDGTEREPPAGGRGRGLEEERGAHTVAEAVDRAGLREDGEGGGAGPRRPGALP